jgi:hypothetical protein
MQVKFGDIAGAEARSMNGPPKRPTTRSSPTLATSTRSRRGQRTTACRTHVWDTSRKAGREGAPWVPCVLTMEAVLPVADIRLLLLNGTNRRRVRGRRHGRCRPFAGFLPSTTYYRRISAYYLPIICRGGAAAAIPPHRAAGMVSVPLGFAPAFTPRHHAMRAPGVTTRNCLPVS